MHRLGAFKRTQEQEVQEAVQQELTSSGNEDTGGDSSSWAGQWINDEDSDIEVEDEGNGAGDANGVKDERPSSTNPPEKQANPGSKDLPVDAAQADTTQPEGVQLQHVTSDDSNLADDENVQTSLTSEEEDAVNMPGSFHMKPTPYQNPAAPEGLIARIRNGFGFGT